MEEKDFNVYDRKENPQEMKHLYVIYVVVCTEELKTLDHSESLNL